MTTLDALAAMTTIVADTGDLGAIARLKPRDATTNPSLITQAFASGEHDSLIKSVQGLDVDRAIDHLTVELGRLILQEIDGRVSTEVDARLSFDTQGTVDKARQYISMYHDLGIHKERVLIKIAATWEGICAAKILEEEGVACNLTLLFTSTQARACASANVTLISPFVGRITDFQKANEQKTVIATHEDMGINSVKEIYQFYKRHGYRTQIMGASFRSTAQILALAGCDLLTIAPALLDELSAMHEPVICQLTSPATVLPKPAPLSADDFKIAQESHPFNALLLNGIHGFIKARQELADRLTD